MEIIRGGFKCCYLELDQLSHNIAYGNWETWSSGIRSPFLPRQIFYWGFCGDTVKPGTYSVQCIALIYIVSVLDACSFSRA
jgi:hypothetical protein